ncbi:MAG: family 10 glycosylhydrolase [Spirulinaceae cyanobacterium SM2_1_0]|nr:family 10 glycosylhydrolase [Spirulinaceae cyanobacterium SM2_1_0]
MLCTGAIALWPLTAQAQAARFGVIRTRDNAQQWTEITGRLRQANLDYCLVDWTTANTPNSLERENVGVLLLPNVETIDSTQAALLQVWLEAGGRAVVTGPTGSLSPPAVQTQLRSLLGSYWGFPLPTPTPLRAASSARISGVAPTTTARGGAIIPTGADSEAIAVWQTDGEPPAVVANDRATFLGWRWGSDQTSNTSLDTAWLRAALNRYSSLAPHQTSSGRRCDGTVASERPSSAADFTPTPATQPNRPATPSQPSRQPVQPLPAETLVADEATDDALDSILDRDRPARPAPTPQPSGQPIPAARVRALQEQLEQWIGRYESAVLLGQVSNGGAELSLAQAIAEVENRRQGQRRSPNLRPVNDIAAEARQGLNRFLTLTQQRAFGEAWQEWLQARNLLWENYPTSTPLRYPETRAMWLDRGTIVRTRSESELARIFDRLEDAGVNTVFFETVNASYTIYPSQVAPEQNPFTVGWDPLAAAVKLAHERDMELHAWVWVFAAANQRHNQIVRQPRTYLGPVLSRHPDWVGTDRQGNPFQSNSRKAFFDPAHPEVRAYLLALIDEIATNYDVDGIQLDYIRYPFQDPSVNQVYGFGVASRSQFRRLTGVDPVSINPGDRLWTRWTQFRIQQVDGFVASVSELLDREHPEVLLSAAVFPLPPSERLARLQQNWESWTEAGYLDLVVPMTYADNTENLQRLTEPLFSRSLENSTLFLPGIRLLGLPTTAALDQMQYLRDSSAGGYALFAAENLSLNLQTILSRTQGEQQGQLPLAHRQPFEAAAGRYDLLQREWAIALSNEQLVMDAATLRAWGQQAAAVDAALRLLAEQPSVTNLNRARSLLRSFRLSFPGWLRQHGAQRPYQVEAWFNRLASLEKLLQYGEQQVL